jgi:hypothetical protein
MAGEGSWRWSMLPGGGSAQDTALVDPTKSDQYSVISSHVQVAGLDVCDVYLPRSRYLLLGLLHNKSGILIVAYADC